MIMTIPVFVLLAFAAWTLLTLLLSVGVYRWTLILTGHASISEWRADIPQRSEWYQRAMRAHMNCVENLSVFCALVVVLTAANVHSARVDALSIALIVSRIGQTLVHLAPSVNEMLATLRFALFFIQVICMISIGAIILLLSIN